MHEPAEQPPFLAVVGHDEQVVAARDQVRGDVGEGAGAVDGGFFVEQGFYVAGGGDDDGGGGTEFEGEEGAVLVGPLCESVPSAGCMLGEEGEGVREVSAAFGELVEIP